MRKSDENVPPPITKAMSDGNIFYDALLTRPESLADLLPYDEVVSEENIIVCKDGSFGIVFEAAPIQHETLPSLDIKELVDSLKTWFNLPENTVLQVIYDQSYVSSLDKKFQELELSLGSPGHPVSKALFERRLKTIRGFCGSGHLMSPLQRKLLIAIRYFPSTPLKAPIHEILKPEEATIRREMTAVIAELTDFKNMSIDFEKASKIHLRRLSADDLLDYLRRFFNPKTYYERPFARFNPRFPFAKQILYSSPTLNYSGIEREGVKTRTLSLKTSPERAYPGGMAYFTELLFPFRLILNFSFPSKGKVKKYFDLKEFFLENTPSARARHQKEEILAVQERLAKGDRCVHMTFNVVVEGETDEILSERLRALTNVFQNDLESEVIKEDDIGLGLALNGLPLMYSPKADLSSQRFIRILRSDAVRFLPIFDSFRGLTRPTQLYLSRENNIVRFSLTENETSNHTVVLADSGSGKSSFVIDAVQAAKRLTPEPLIFVIDKKSSYLMLSRYFDADLTIFDRREEDMPFSPFRGVYDEEKVAFLTNLILAGVRLTSPTFAVEGDHTSMLGTAINMAYKKALSSRGLAYVEGELVKNPSAEEDITLSMDDVVAELSRLSSILEWEKSEEKIQVFIQQLRPFFGEGHYARFFRGKRKPRGEKKSSLFYIYDLDALDSEPILQALMTMAVVEEIRQTIKLPENQNRGGFIVIEELGMIGGDNPSAARFIKDAAETFRKLGYFLIGLTPRPQNYFEMEAGRAMWGVADNYIFLQMSPDNVRYLKDRSDLIDEASSEIIKSLRTVRGEFADVFYMTKKKTQAGAFRFFQTPLDRWLAPTNARSLHEARAALERFPNEKWRALSFLAEKYPKGLG